MKHIMERFVIHFTAATFLTMAVFFFYKNLQTSWISHDPRHLLVTSALTVFALSTLREPFDVAGGQTLKKTVFDFLSWASGCSVAVWGLYRFLG